jgi:hypothetical protein
MAPRPRQRGAWMGRSLASDGGVIERDNFLSYRKPILWKFFRKMASGGSVGGSSIVTVIAPAPDAHPTGTRLLI